MAHKAPLRHAMDFVYTSPWSETLIWNLNWSKSFVFYENVWWPFWLSLNMLTRWCDAGCIEQSKLGLSHLDLYFISHDILYHQTSTSWCYERRYHGNFHILQVCQTISQISDQTEICRSQFRYIEPSKSLRGALHLMIRGHSVKVDSIYRRHFTSKGIPIIKVRPSHLYNGNSRAGKTTSLYWIRPLLATIVSVHMAMPT